MRLLAGALAALKQARGKTNAEIAALLWISPLTVRRHLENVFAKLACEREPPAVTRLSA